MTYQEYIHYHLQGDAGVEERMIASLCQHYALNEWDTFRLIYYYTMTYHIPSALSMLLDGERDMKRLKFRTDRRYVRCNGSCCGLPADWNYSKGQFCEALQICKTKGICYWADIKKDIEELHQYDWGRASGFNANSSEKRAQFYGMSMANYMRWLWNNPQAGQSPYKMFEGVMAPMTNEHGEFVKDNEGNLVYIYHKERTL